MQITNKQMVPISSAPKDNDGNPAELDGGVEYEVVDAIGDPVEGFTVTKDEALLMKHELPTDGLTALVIPPDDFTGSVHVKGTADADLGEGVETISNLSEALDVTSVRATNLGIGFGSSIAKELPA